MRSRTTALAFATLLGSPALADGPAPAPEKALCTFRTVQALPEGDGSMDPEIKLLREDLRRPPFTAWKTFRMLERKEQQLAEGATASFPTPDGRTLALTYAGHVIRNNKHAIRAVVDVRGGANAGTAHTTITLDEGGHFIVAGHKHQGGILIYAVSCKTAQ